MIWRYGKSGIKLPIFLTVAYFYVQFTIKTALRGRLGDRDRDRDRDREMGRLGD